MAYKIISIEPFNCEYVEMLTDYEQLVIFRRCPNGAWEEVMGESWEPVYIGYEKLEQIYQEYKNENH